jgi:hypothetical protein
MNLDDGEVQAAYYGLCGFVRERAIAKRSVPAEVLRVRHRLDAHVRLSSTRHVTSWAAADQARSEVWIGATATAAILGRGPRYVQRHAEEIGGRLIGGRYVFRESDVIDYLERQTRGGTSPGN